MDSIDSSELFGGCARKRSSIAVERWRKAKSKPVAADPQNLIESTSIAQLSFIIIHGIVTSLWINC
jgi:hypothetical protein